jgi:ribosome recycling factor
MSEINIKQAEEKMHKAIAALDHELAGLRAGRASANILDPVVVDVYGSRMPLNQVATISVPEARLLSVQVWDKSNVKAVEKGIADANLGLNPSVDGQVVRISIPALTEERRKELVKLAHKYGENIKISVRNVRRDMMDLIKKQEKDGDISEDEMHKFSNKVQEITDQFIDIVDKRVSKKEAEISHI